MGYIGCLERSRQRSRTPDALVQRVTCSKAARLVLRASFSWSMWSTCSWLTALWLATCSVHRSQTQIRETGERRRETAGSQRSDTEAETALTGKTEELRWRRARSSVNAKIPEVKTVCFCSTKSRAEVWKVWKRDVEFTLIAFSLGTFSYSSSKAHKREKRFIIVQFHLSNSFSQDKKNTWS